MLDELVATARSPGQQRSQTTRGSLDLADVPGSAMHPGPPFAARFPHARGKEREVARGNEVDRNAHQRPLDHAPPFERPRQRVALEVFESGPKADVARGRVLHLQAAHALERARKRKTGSLEQ